MKVNNIDFHNQRNDENFGFVTDVLEKLKKQTPASLDLTAPMLARFETAVANQDTSYKIVAKSAYTEELQKLDAISDATLIGFVSQLKSFRKYHSDPEFQKAATRVLVERDAFGNFQKKSYMAQASDTVNFLEVLKGKRAGDITLLGMQGWVTQIENNHNAFMALFKDRHNEKLEKENLTRLRECRIETEEAYLAITERLDAAIIFNGESKYKAFVTDLNLTIDYYNNLIAQRRGRAAAEKEKKEKEKNPEIITGEDLNN